MVHAIIITAGRAARLVALSSCLFAIGCASVGAPLAVTRMDPPQQHLAVPFFPDETDQCGPATLASVLNYWGIPTTPAEIKDEIYVPRIRGSLPFDLVIAAERRALAARAMRGTLEGIKEEVDAGRPVIALLNTRSAKQPYGHFVVITGFDEERLGFLAHSGPYRDYFVSYADFYTQWDRAGRWILTASPAQTVRQP